MLFQLRGYALPASLLLLGISSYDNVEAFVARPQSSPLRQSLHTFSGKGDDAQESAPIARKPTALNFPSLDDSEANEIESSAAGVSPRTARIVSPLAALLSMPIVLAGGADGANADVGDFEAACESYFPRALPSSQILAAATETLTAYGSKGDVLFGTAICPDEVNTKPGKLSLATALQDNVSNQNGVFNLGGLAGLPFVGISGMGAFLSHCPEKGRVVIFFGPHVGVSENGVVGKVERIGRKKLSGACGAALGAYKALSAEKLERKKLDTVKQEEIAIKEALAVLESSGATESVVRTRINIINNLKDALIELAEESDALESENADLRKQIAAVGGDTLDYQEDYIIDQLRPKLQDVSFTDENRAVAYVTRQVYSMIFDMLKQQLKTSWKDPTFWDNVQEITLLGGILINRGLAEDYFQPLKFETLAKRGKMIERVDLLETAFGSLA